MDSQKAIARIPSEIFSAIFSLVPNDNSLNVTRGLWPIGRVCSFWRSILLSDPTLWTHLNISGSLPATPVHLCSRYPWRPRLLSEYLSRSANLSLHIAIDHAHASVGSDLEVKMFYQTLALHTVASFRITFPLHLRDDEDVDIAGYLRLLKP